MTRSRPWLTAMLQLLILLAVVAGGSPWLTAGASHLPVLRRSSDITLHGHQPRPVFNGSIVPGGVYSPGELRAAIAHDPVVAAHYRAADLEQMHAVTLTQGRAAYVSYRVGDRVYWTRDRVWLKAGETVLTDGTTTIRARCGNCVSDVKQQAVAAVEPARGELDDFVVPPTPDPEGDALAAEAEPALGDLLEVPFGREALAFLAPGGALLIPDLTDSGSRRDDLPPLFAPPFVVGGGTRSVAPDVPVPPPFVPGDSTGVPGDSGGSGIRGDGDTTTGTSTGGPGGFTSGVPRDLTDGDPGSDSSGSSTGSLIGGGSPSTGEVTTSSSGATPAPEPGLLWLVASGVIGVASRRLRAK